MSALFDDKKTQYKPKVETKDVLKGQHAFEAGIYMMLGKEFGGQSEGWEVRWEAKNFKPSKYNQKFLTEINEQVKGEKAKVAEIYFRGLYLCDVDESMPPSTVHKKIMEALTYKLSKKGGV